MFFDTSLMTSRRLGKAWKAGFNIFEHNSDDKITVSNVCQKLDSWIGSDHDEAERRLSLRTSSVMVDGATRLYKRQLQELYDDVLDLENQMLCRKRGRLLFEGSGTPSEDEEQTTDSDCIETDKTNDNIQSSNRKISSAKTLAKPYSKDMLVGVTGRSHNARGAERIVDYSETSNEILSPDIAQGGFSSKVDKQVQVSPTLQQNRIHPNNKSFDENLPFGFVVVYDNFNSRIPSKIVFSSLNADVNKFTGV